MRKWKRNISALLVGLLVFGQMPMTAYADGDAEDVEVASKVIEKEDNEPNVTKDEVVSDKTSEDEAEQVNTETSDNGKETTNTDGTSGGENEPEGTDSTKDKTSDNTVEPDKTLDNSVDKNEEVDNENMPENGNTLENNDEDQNDPSSVDDETKAIEDEETLEIDADELEIALMSILAEAELMTVEATEIEAGVITLGMTQEEINAAVESAEGTISVAAGDYGNLDLNVTGKTVYIEDGSKTTKFRFMTLTECELVLNNNLTINSQENIVESDKCAFELEDSNVKGNSKTLRVECINSGKNKPNAYAMSTKGNSVTLNKVNLKVSGSNGDRGLLNINSKIFKAYDSDINVCGNGGFNQWESAGCPNICVGRDAVCATREILFKNCTVNASDAKNAYGDGMQINKTTDPCTITFDSCEVNFDNNGGNGFMGQISSGDLTKKVIFIDSDVSACRNGQGKKGACIGFANAAITLTNNGKKGSHELNVSDNYKLGIAANGLGGFTSINAKGYKITANENGVDADDGVFGYGIYLGRDGSSFENCILTAEKNGKDGITLGGETKIPLEKCDIRAVLNGRNGLTTNTETKWSDVKLLCSCNGQKESDFFDAKMNKPLSFANGCSGSIGKAVLDNSSTTDASSIILANCDSDCNAVTNGDALYILKSETDDTVEKTTKGALCHHALDWENGEQISEPTDTKYGRKKVVCSVCKGDTEWIPLVRVIYDKNTEDEVTQMPDGATNLPYGALIQVGGKPIRSNYTFTGWYLDKETEGKAPANLIDVKPTVTLYAGWSKGTVAPATDPDPTPKPEDSKPKPKSTDPDPTPNIPTVPPTTPTVIVPPVTPTTVVPPVPPVATVPPVLTTVPAVNVGVPVPNTPRMEEIPDDATPLDGTPANDEGKLIEDGDTPLAGGLFPNSDAWALVNFALMNLAVFESLMLLIGYFIKTKNDKEEEQEKEDRKKLKKKGVVRVLSIPVAIISIIAFILTEDITKPTGFVDKYTLLMALIALVQTIVVMFSRKKYETEEEKEDVEAV